MTVSQLRDDNQYSFCALQFLFVCLFVCLFLGGGEGRGGEGRGGVEGRSFIRLLKGAYKIFLPTGWALIQLNTEYRTLNGLD